MRRVGVCSWSLAPSGATELAERVRAAGLDAVQLALSPLELDGQGERSVTGTARILDGAGIEILSGMFAPVGEDYSTLETIRVTGGLVPDETWERNREGAQRVSRIAQALGLDLVTFHAGFLGELDHGRRERTLDRLRVVADTFAERGVRLALETGQETATELAGALSELAHPNLGINFDPANLILYGNGDPIEALELLAPHVLQFHIKDALPSDVAGAWGREVVAGTGDVDWRRFFALAASRAPDADFVIEREAGADRVADIRAAHELIDRHGGAR